MIFLVPPASTWSRLRNSTSPGQPPLRSRSHPLGTSTLDLRATRQVRQANKELETMLLCAEYALECKSTKVVLHLIFPEDLGGNCVDGPTSFWALRESQLLEGVNDAHRYAGYLCRIAGAEHKRPIAVLSSGKNFSVDFHRGWPNFALHNNILSYRGPLPWSCGCNGHSVLHGVDDQGAFVSTQNRSFGVRFWKALLHASWAPETKMSLRVGEDVAQFAPDPMLSGSLSSGCDSWRSCFDSWKLGSLSITSSAELRSSSCVPLISAWRVLSGGTSSCASSSSSTTSTFPSSTVSSPTAGPVVVTQRRAGSLTARSRSPRTTKRPLVSLRPRRDGGNGLLTGVRRRLVNARYRQSVPFVH